MILRMGTIAALFTGFAIMPAAAADTGVHCGDTFTTNVTLTRDLNCTGDGLHMVDPRSTRANLTLNLAGHSIRGNGTGTGVIADADTLAIANGTITGFAQGIVRGGPVISLTRMRISRTNSWLAGRYGGRATVMDSRFVDAGPGGASATTPLTVNNSQFVRSSIYSGSQSNTYVYNSQFTEGNITATYLQASGNVINSCPDGAVAGFDNSRYGGGTQLSGNTIRGCDIGINLSAWEWDSAIEGNRLSGNTIGIQYRGTLPRALKITGNLLDKNAGDGVLGTGVSPVTITANSTSKNGGHAINVSGAQVIDGGANIATSNGATPACVGVVCQ